MRTRGDTEVLVHLAEQYAPVNRASASRECSRLPYGTLHEDVSSSAAIGWEKPLYYCVSPDLFVFASEIKGLLAHPRVPASSTQRPYLPTSPSAMSRRRAPSLPASGSSRRATFSRWSSEARHGSSPTGSRRSRGSTPRFWTSSRARPDMPFDATSRRRSTAVWCPMSRWGVPQWGDRLQRDRRDHVATKPQAGQDVHDRLRRRRRL